MLILSSEAIEKAASPQLWTDTMELALKAVSDTQFFVPERTLVEMGDNSLVIMPAVGPDMFITKLLSVFPSNAAKGEKVVHGQLVLNEEKTGKTLAFFNGSKLVFMRSAAVAAVGIRHLADPMATSLGIIGAGELARHIAWLAATERDFDRIFVYDSSFKAVQEFMSFVNHRLPDLEVAICEDAMQVASHSEVIVTATTSYEPVLPNLEDLLLGKTFICMGSFKPDMRELPEAVFRLIDQIWLDSDESLIHTGDVLFPLENEFVKPQKVKHISHLINSPKELSFRETRLFKSAGSGIFDLFAAKLVYEHALKNKLGQEVRL